MKRVLLLTHGHMASGIRNTVSILLGNSEHLDTIDAYVDEHNLTDQLNRYFQEMDADDQLIALADLMGASTYQQLLMHCHRDNMFIIAGINLVLILELLIDKNKEFTKSELQQLVIQSREAMVLHDQSIYAEGETSAEDTDFF